MKMYIMKITALMVLSLNAQATLWQYKVSGHLDRVDFNVTNHLTGYTVNWEQAEDLLGSAYELSFILDDSVTPTFSTNSIYPAISDPVVKLNDRVVFRGDFDRQGVLEGEPNRAHTWTMFLFPPALQEVPLIPDPIAVEVKSPFGDTTMTELNLSSLNLFLVDKDKALYSNTPPELVAPDGDEFERKQFSLVWSREEDIVIPGDPGRDDLAVSYSIKGEVDTFSKTLVPIPGAVWLFVPAILGLLAMRLEFKVEIL